jgi:protein disulfide-isomerase
MMAGRAVLGIAAAGMVSVATMAKAGGEWLTDFEAAKQEAAKRNLPILADFSGSDWCSWCKRLDQEVFQDAGFKEFASERFVLFMADFPRNKPQPEAEKQQNKDLAETFKVRGFPTVMILDAKGAVLARTGYRRGGAAAYVEHLKELTNDKPQPAAPAETGEAPESR